MRLLYQTPFYHFKVALSNILSKQKTLLTPLLSLLALLASFNSYATETVYISAVKAKVFTEPRFNAPVKTTLTKGNTVTLIKTQGVWVQIEAQSPKSEIQGWVSKFIISKTPLTERITILPNDEQIKLKDVRRRSSAITTAAAARGLAATIKNNAQDSYAANPEAVDYMESIKISPRELRHFAQPLTQQLEQTEQQNLSPEGNS